MERVAFVFPGQGAQYPGMGKPLYDRYPEVRALYEKAEKIRPGITELCFSGSAEDLKQTQNTQPCLFLTELAAATVLANSGLQPAALAGFSLGEITALTFGGAFDPVQGFDIVCRRGEQMAAAGAGMQTSMAAVLKLDADAVETVCAAHEQLYPVNYNCPGQITVSGRSDSLDAAKKDFLAAGGRVVPLAVSGAFHSPFMVDAAETFGKYLASCQIQPPQIPVYSNRTAQPYGQEVRELMQSQIHHPVLWEKSIRAMAEDGICAFIEVGPGQTLSKLIQKTLPEVKTYHAETPENIASIVSEVPVC